MVHTSHKAKKLAVANAPTIEAVTGEMLRLANEQQAIEWLEALEKSFIVSKHQIDEKTKRKSLILWIRGYEVTKEEKEKGYLGNFAAITYKPAANRWTLYPTKIFLDLAKHPQRKYVNDAKHPNWGHPILRTIKKKKTYSTVEEAEADLQKLHEQFPMASIPALKRFYLMIYSRENNSEKPINKYVFRIKVLPEGGFYIDYKINEYKPKLPIKTDSKKAVVQTKEAVTSAVAQPQTPENPKGFFASKEELRRKKKRR